MTDSPGGAAGSLDLVSEDGLVEGWCWDPGAPERRINLTIFVEGAPVGSAVASRHRQDLVAAGIGDGMYGFRFYLPWALLGQHRRLQISARDAQTDLQIGDPIVLRPIEAATLDDRLASLERQLHLLRARLNDIEDMRGPNASDLPVYHTVGAFFGQLAADLEEGRSTSATLRLSARIDGLSGAFAPFDLKASLQPKLICLVQATADFPVVYACLRRLSEASSARDDVDIVLIDFGAFDDVALMPSFVRGLRYIRAARSQPVMEINRLLEASSAAVCTMLDANCHLRAQWFEEVVAVMDGDRQIGGVSSKLLRDETVVESVGLQLSPQGRLEDFASGGLAEDIGSTYARKVTAVTPQIATFRMKALQSIGWLEPNADLDLSIVRASVALDRSSWSQIYQPFAIVDWVGGDRASARWRRAVAGARELAPRAGKADDAPEHAFVLVNRSHAVVDVDKLAPALRMLHTQNYVATILHLFNADDPVRVAFARGGVRTLTRGQYGSVLEFLTAMGKDAKLLYCDDATDVTAEHLLKFLPNAEVVNGQTDLSRRSARAAPALS